jgi:hypothetical protein
MLGKVTNYNRLFPTILNRAVVSIGNEKATEAMLDSLLVGDRDALLLGIYRATFGPTADFSTACQGCGEVKNVTVDVAADIKSKVLIDPANDRTFTVKGKKDEYLVTLPTGVTQKAMIAADDKNGAEITSVLLENTVLKINETSVVSPIQIKNLGLVDRRTIVQEIYSRNPGPKFENIVLACPDCDGEVVVPISVGGLFRF